MFAEAKYGASCSISRSIMVESQLSVLTDKSTGDWSYRLPVCPWQSSSRSTSFTYLPASNVSDRCLLSAIRRENCSFLFCLLVLFDYSSSVFFSFFHCCSQPTAFWKEDNGNSFLLLYCVTCKPYAHTHYIMYTTHTPINFRPPPSSWIDGSWLFFLLLTFCVKQ